MWNLIFLAAVLPALPEADLLHRQAAAHFEAGRCRDAARAEARAFDLWSRLPGLPAGALIPLHANLAEMYVCAGRLTDAERHAGQALTLIASDCPTCLREKANSLSVRARVAYESRRVPEAVTLREEVTRVLEKLPGEPVRLAVAIANTGWLLGAEADYPAAREHFERALGILTTAHRTDDLAYARILLNRGMVCHKQGDYEQADRDYLEAIPVLTARLGENHSEVVLALAERAVLLRKLGRKQEAKQLEGQVATRRQPAPATVDVLALRCTR